MRNANGRKAGRSKSAKPVGVLETHYSLIVARKVVAALKTVWPKSWDGTVESWANGREQGLSVHISTSAGLSFRANVAQVCNGESILVIVDRAKYFEHGHQPTQDAWDNSVDFKPGEYTKAAKAIIKEIRTRTK